LPVAFEAILVTYPSTARHFIARSGHRKDIYVAGIDQEGLRIQTNKENKSF